MNFSDPVYLWLAAAIAIPAVLVLIAEFLLRNRGGLLRGWASAVLIGTCWIACMGLILYRVS
jgi:hypothetical protein